MSVGHMDAWVLNLEECFGLTGVAPDIDGGLTGVAYNHDEMSKSTIWFHFFS